jgi:hypothetical protein
MHNNVLWLHISLLRTEKNTVGVIKNEVLNQFNCASAFLNHFPNTVSFCFYNISFCQRGGFSFSNIEIYSKFCNVKEIRTKMKVFNIGKTLVSQLVTGPRYRSSGSNLDISLRISTAIML